MTKISINLVLDLINKNWHKVHDFTFMSKANFIQLVKLCTNMAYLVFDGTYSHLARPLVELAMVDLLAFVTKKI